MKIGNQPNRSPWNPVRLKIAAWLVRAIPTGKEDLDRVEETGRDVGRELAPDRRGADLEESLRQAFAALGFKPEVRSSSDGRVTCELGNCPYRDSVRANPEVICTLHRGLTIGLLERLEPDARLTRFEPRDPDVAGCLVEVVNGTAAG